MSDTLLFAALARARFLKGDERLALARYLETPARFAALRPSEWEGLIGRPLRAQIGPASEYLQAAETDLALAAKLGIGYAVYDRSGYPPLLREITDPPLLLYYRGALPNPEKPMAAVVGTRRPSVEAQMQAYRFGRDFGAAGVTVVSGLALGIDAQAHRGNLDGGGATVAVLGSGLDTIYPGNNKALARRILDLGGALLGEYPPMEPPLRYHFPERNRLIAALARATIVVEAPEKSGALITAEFAYEMGRDLWLGSVGLASVRGEGSRRLAAEGAPTAADAKTVLADWGWPVLPPPAAKSSTPPFSRTSAKAEGLAASANYGAGLARDLERELFTDDIPTSRGAT